VFHFAFHWRSGSLTKCYVTEPVKFAETAC
jgi:hypothetical protein